MKTNELLLASDHRGMELKDKINDWICPLDEEEGTKLNIAVMHDIGVYSDKKKVDYPDIANKFADEMSITSHGVIVCGSGFGVNIAVNRHKHIRAATCRTVKEVEMARKHNNINVLCLGADFTSPVQAFKMIRAFFLTKFEGGRHLTRIKKLS